MKFNDKVAYLRQKKGYTQAELAEMVNVTQPAIVSYEAGKTKPRKNTAIFLAKALGVSYEELVEEQA